MARHHVALAAKAEKRLPPGGSGRVSTFTPVSRSVRRRPVRRAHSPCGHLIAHRPEVGRRWVPLSSSRTTKATPDSRSSTGRRFGFDIPAARPGASGCRPRVDVRRAWRSGRAPEWRSHTRQPALRWCRCSTPGGQALFSPARWCTLHSCICSGAPGVGVAHLDHSPRGDSATHGAGLGVDDVPLARSRRADAPRSALQAGGSNPID
jgi:hypothetical protein